MLHWSWVSCQIQCLAVDFFRQTDGSAKIKFMDTALPWPSFTSSDGSRSVAPTEVQGRGGIKIIWEDLNLWRRTSHFYLNMYWIWLLSSTIWKHLSVDIDGHTSIRFLKLGCENTLGKAQHSKAHCRTLKLNPALPLQWWALQLPSLWCHFFLCRKGPKAINALQQVGSSARRQGCAWASCWS